MKSGCRYVLSIGLGAAMELVSFRLMWHLTEWSLGAIMFSAVLIYVIGIFIGWALTGLVKPKHSKIVKMRKQRKHQIYTFK